MGNNNHHLTRREIAILLIIVDGKKNRVNLNKSRKSIIVK
jgi:DNA-binding CsgD family transcriptional regulator